MCAPPAGLPLAPYTPARAAEAAAKVPGTDEWNRWKPMCWVGWCRLDPAGFESAWFQLLKLANDEPLSKLAFNFNLRPYSWDQYYSLPLRPRRCQIKALVGSRVLQVEPRFESAIAKIKINCFQVLLSIAYCDPIIWSQATWRRAPGRALH